MSNGCPEKPMTLGSAGVGYRLRISLESTSGELRELSSYAGRVVVLFWEDRERQHDNQALKDALGAYSGDPRLTNEVAVVAVGDVSAFDFAPARAVVRASLSAIARLLGIELLFDWKAELTRAPLELEPRKSNVVVLDREGGVAWKAPGKLDVAARERVLDVVRELLGPSP